jgi:hypothetical protein
MRSVTYSLGLISTIAFMISFASFVENLNAGKYLIEYVWRALSSISGWDTFVEVLRTALHDVLVWWRGIVASLLFLLPWKLPPWVHDAISLVIFGIGRAYAQSQSLFDRTRDRLEDVADDLPDPEIYRLTLETWLKRLQGVLNSVTLLLLLIVAAIVADGMYFANTVDSELYSRATYLGAGLLAWIALISLIKLIIHRFPGRIVDEAMQQEFPPRRRRRVR